MSLLSLSRRCKDSVQLIVQRNLTYMSGGGAAAATSQPFLSQSYNDLSGGVVRRGGERRYPELRRFSTGGMTQPSDLHAWGIYVGEERQRFVSTSRERMNLSREVLPEVPEEGRSQTSHSDILLPTPHQVQADQITPTSARNRRINQSLQRLDSQERTPSQRYLSSSQSGDPMMRPVKQSSVDLGKKLSSSSLGSPSEGEQDRNLLLGLAMQSLTQAKQHSASQQGAGSSYQPRSLYSSKLSSVSSNGSSDSAYVSSANQDECRSPAAATSLQRRSLDEGLHSYSYPGPNSDSGFLDHTDRAEEDMVEWEVSVSMLFRQHSMTVRSLR